MKTVRHLLDDFRFWLAIVGISFLLGVLSTKFASVIASFLTEIYAEYVVLPEYVQYFGVASFILAIIIVAGIIFRLVKLETVENCKTCLWIWWKLKKILMNSSLKYKEKNGFSIPLSKCRKRKKGSGVVLSLQIVPENKVSDYKKFTKELDGRLRKESGNKILRQVKYGNFSDGWVRYLIEINDGHESQNQGGRSS